MPELKTCPFCGADAELRNNADERAGAANAHWVTCVGHPSENGCLDTACFDSAEEAVEFWNRRRGEDALAAENTLLRDAVAKLRAEAEARISSPRGKCYCWENGETCTCYPEHQARINTWVRVLDLLPRETPNA